MTTTSTSDSTPWTTRRVRDRWLVAVGACSTIALIPSNDRSHHTIGPGRRCQDGVGSVWLRFRFPYRVTEWWPGHPAASGWRKSASRVSCPITYVGGLLSVGHQVAGPDGLD